MPDELNFENHDHPFNDKNIYFEKGIEFSFIKEGPLLRNLPELKNDESLALFERLGITNAKEYFKVISEFKTAMTNFEEAHKVGVVAMMNVQNFKFESPALPTVDSQ